jgi:hypothetical protein
MGKQKRSENTYQKINTIFKRDANNVIMPYDEFAVPELEWLRDCKFDAEEKVDGTNTRIEVTREFIKSDIGNNIGIKWNVTYKGKTDNAQIPKMLYAYLTTELTEDKVLNALGLSKEMYVTDELMQEKTWSVLNTQFNVYELDETKIPKRYTLYGEGFGAGIQSGGYYRKDNSFIGFDVKVDDMYLLRENRDEIFKKLGVDIVPFMGTFTIDEAIEYVKKGFNSNIAEETHLAEGLVLRTPMGLKTRKGERIIFKVKTCDFQKYFNTYGTYDKVDQPKNENY